MSSKTVLSGVKIGVIGCGNMGRALVRGLVEKSAYPQNLTVFDVDAKKTAALKKDAAVKVAKTNRQCVSLSDVAILAVKPNILPEVCGEIATSLGKDCLVISVAAGVSIASIAGWLKRPVAIVRVMPNMPALVGAGMSAFSVGKHVSVKQRKAAEAVLSAVGEIQQVPEKALDLVTAISGSGPAYFFLLAEKLVEAAHGLGMKADAAKKLVYQTAFGSGRVMVESQEDPDVLIERVASKGGTTEAALKVFQRQGLGKVVQDAVKAACRRSREIREGK